MRKLTLFVLLVLITGSAAIAQEFSFSAQFRERSELFGKQLLEGQSMDVWHDLRTRLAADVIVNEDVSMKLEFQDARRMGTESSRLNTGAQAFDLRQGFVNVKNLWNTVFDAKVGRMVLAYGNERLIGAIDWSNFGQSFDGGVASANFRNFRIDALGVVLSKNSANPYTRDVFLTGLWAVWNPRADMNSVQPFLLYDNPLGSNGRVRRYTAGVYTNWMFNMLDVSVEGAYQFGEFPNMFVGNDPNNDPMALGAYMVGLRAGYTLKKASNLRIGVGFDMLSGDAAPDAGADDETIETFSTLYATNHKFYGHMDYFTQFGNTPMSFGLRDIMVQLSINRGESHEFGVDIHMFSTAVDPGDWFEGTSAESAIGNEIDFWYTCEIAKAFWATVGFSVFDLPDDEKRPMFRNTGEAVFMKTAKWGWVQIMVNI